MGRTVKYHTRSDLCPILFCSAAKKTSIQFLLGQLIGMQLSILFEQSIVCKRIVKKAAARKTVEKLLFFSSPLEVRGNLARKLFQGLKYS